MRELGREGNNKRADGRPKERRGEFAEAAFLMQITERGWVISQPFGHKQGYDFIVDNGRDLWRVQVKSTEVASSKYRARVTLGRGNQSKTPYQPWEVDFFAILLLNGMVWYIVPLADVEGKVGFRVPLAGHAKGTVFERFLDGWQLMAWAGEAAERKRLRAKLAAKKRRGRKQLLTIHACADTAYVM